MNSRIVLLIAVLGFVAYAKGSPASSSGAPRDAARSFMTEYRAGLKASFIEASKRVASGETKTDRELFEFLRPQTEKARKSAQVAFDAMCEKEIPESFVGSEKKVSSVLSSIAGGF